MNLKTTIDQLVKTLDVIAATKEDILDEGLFIRYLHDIANAAILIGTMSSDLLKDKTASKESKGMAFEITTHFNLTIKQLLLLMRNILIENNKAAIFLADGKISTNDLLEHKTNSTRAFIDAIAKSSQAIKSYSDQKDNLTLLRHYERSRLVADPQEVYHAQIKEIQSQSKALKDQKAELFTVQKCVDQLARQFITKMNAVQKSYEALSIQMGRFLTLMTEIDDFEDAQIRGVFNEIINHSQKDLGDEELANSVLQQVQELPTNDYIVDYNNAMVVSRSIDFKLNLKRWIDVNLLPFIIDAIDSYKELQSRVGVAMHNTNNKMSLTKPENIEEAKNDILQVLTQLDKEIENQYISVSKIIDYHKKLVLSEMQLSRIFQDKEFLFFGLQGSVNQVIKAQSAKIGAVTRLIEDKWKAFIHVTEEWKTPLIRSYKEEVAKCLRTRFSQKSTEIYDQVFQNNPFLSEVFIVDRKKKELKATEALAHWKKGFHSSILILGNQLSGKTTLAKKIASNYSSRHSFFIKPNETLSCYGHRFNVKLDLKAALEHITLYADNVPPLVVIDDLELWQGQGTSLLDNIEFLTGFLNRQGNKIMIIATIGSVLYQKISHFIDVRDCFHSIIDVSRCELDEAKQTVIIRHDATHKILLNTKKQAISKSEMNKIIKVIYKQCDGNIGDVLQRWTFGSLSIDASHVIFEHQYSELPSVITPKNEALIETLFLNKRLKEADLIEIFGRILFGQYRDGLRQLINDQLVIRDLDGFLLINPVVANDLIREFNYQDEFINTVY